MSAGAVIIVAMSFIFLICIYALALSSRDDNDITQQIIREHEEEIKRLRARYE